MRFLFYLLRYIAAKVRISWEHDGEVWKAVLLGLLVTFALVGWSFFPREWLWVQVWGNVIAFGIGIPIAVLVLAGFALILVDIGKWVRDRYREWRSMR